MPNKQKQIHTVYVVAKNEGSGYVTVSFVTHDAQKAYQFAEDNPSYEVLPSVSI